MLTVHWQHIILDESVFATYHTHRVARAQDRARAAGVAGDPFPVVNQSPPPGLPFPSSWSPVSARDGLAPATYPYDGLNYDFGFWSLVASGAPLLYSDIHGRTPPPTVTLSGVNVILHATAYYVWDFGGGTGPNAAYIDAFDATLGEYIPDDFVDVAPDDEAQTLTIAANDGYLDTDNITTEIIKARSPVGRISQYQFEYWSPLGGVSAPADVPDPPGAEIIVHNADVLRALAIYETEPPAVLQPISPILPILTVVPTDAGLALVPIGTGPEPVGPDVLRANLLAATKLADAARLVSGEARIELLRGSETMARAAANAAIEERERQKRR